MFRVVGAHSGQSNPAGQGADERIFFLLQADLSCRNTKTSVGVIFTRTNYVTLKYVTDGWGTESNGFRLVITAVKDPKHECKDFRCYQKEFCVHPQLLCDGISHCADGSDESPTKCARKYSPCPHRDDGDGPRGRRRRGQRLRISKA